MKTRVRRDGDLASRAIVQLNPQEDRLGFLVRDRKRDASRACDRYWKVDACPPAHLAPGTRAVVAPVFGKSLHVVGISRTNVHVQPLVSKTAKKK